MSTKKTSGHDDCPDNPCPGYFPYCEGEGKYLSIEDGTWNAALEAAAKELEAMAYEAKCTFDSAHASDVEMRNQARTEELDALACAKRVRSLKRGQS